MKRRGWRYLFFTLAILAGFSAGLTYGWVINPVRHASINPVSLGMAYKTDFVLMTAELYDADGDLAMALVRLNFLGEMGPLTFVESAIEYAQTHHYAPPDLMLMQVLAGDIYQALPGKSN